VSLTLALLVGALLVGAAVQHRGATDLFRQVVWQAYFGVMLPLLLFCSFSIVHFDRRLSLALTAAVVASFLVLAVSMLYGGVVSSDPGERTALALSAGFGNTSFVGFPLAQLVYGHAGVTLAVLYDRFAFIVPALSLSTLIAQLWGPKRALSNASAQLGFLVLNPPVMAMVLALVVRYAGLDVPYASTGQSALAACVAPAGFFLVGLSLPLARGPRLSTAELGRVGGALAIRFGAGIVILYLTGAVLGAHVPRVFYLMAAMPSAFHLIVLSRVYDFHPNVVRLMVAASTVIAVVAVAGTVAL
jgi:hypothetical protein